MGLPTISIVFRTLGITAIQRSEKGTMSMFIRDAKCQGGHILYNVTQIPADLSEPNRAYLERAFTGYITPPKRIYLFVMDEEETVNAALDYFATMEFDYLVGPPDLTAEEAATIASWVKSERLNDHTAKAVLPQVAADHEGIVNFTTQGLMAGDKAYTTAEYCSRIAGLITGTPMTISCTYAPLAELTEVEHKTKDELDKAIDKGEFVLFHDGEKVKVGRGVNSFVTTIQDKGNQFKKIKIVEAMDMIKNDIRVTAQDHYIGKYSNSYDNKCLLIMAIKGYFEGLELNGILERGTSVVEIDVDTQENWLKSKGIDTVEMTEQQIKEANTESYVFLKAKVSILDAIEDITIDITI